MQMIRHLTCFYKKRQLLAHKLFRADGNASRARLNLVRSITCNAGLFSPIFVYTGASPHNGAPSTTFFFFWPQPPKKVFDEGRCIT